MVILHTTFCCLCPKWDSTNTNTLIVCSFLLLSLIIILVYMYLRKRLLCKNERKLLEQINNNNVASSKG